MTNPTVAVLYLFFFVLFSLNMLGLWLGVVPEIIFMWASMISVFGPAITYICGDFIDIPFEKKRLRASAAESAQRKIEDIEIMKNELRPLIKKHEVALRRNLLIASQPDEYGKTSNVQKIEVIRRFIDSTESWNFHIEDDEYLAFIEEEISRLSDGRIQSKFNPDELPISGLEFEYWIAEGLKAYGWEARVTRGAGDQGIDVIASIDGKSIGIQCKLYSGGVGNKAVQEAIAGKQFYQTDIAAVLTNATYTRSARALAATAGVYLLSPHDISTLQEQIGSVSSKRYGVARCGEA